MEVVSPGNATHTLLEVRLEQPDKPSVLIVDDEPDMLDFLQRVLRRRFEVHRCSSAEIALEKLTERNFDVLITDQKMPKVSGIELLETAATDHPDMLRILISGYTELPTIQRAIEKCRIHNYILKPVDSRKLLSAVEKAYKVRDGEALAPPT